MKKALRLGFVVSFFIGAGHGESAGLLWAQTSAPRVNSLSTTTLARSGRLRIFGTGFGAAPGTVLIGEVPAIVSQWTDGVIVAYVPEAARVGVTNLQVATGAGTSNTVAFEVTERQANGRVKWRFEVDGDYMAFRPTIAPDGTIYVHDVNGRLYALQPDGGLKWIFQAGPLFPSGPPAVGPDGTIYIAVGWVIQAVSQNGIIKWQASFPNTQGVIGGPAVGPDGRVYAVLDNHSPGAVALSPTDGRVVWTNPGDPLINEWGQIGLELVFGPSTAGAPTNQFYFACDNAATAPQGHIYAFDLNGNQRWTIASGFSSPPQAAVANDGSVSVGVAAYDPSSGRLRWSAYSTLGSGTDLPTDVGSDGTVYVSPVYQSALAALDGATGSLLWSVPLVGDRVGPVASPLNDVVFLAGQPNYGMPGFFKAFSTSGQSLWQIDMEGVPYPGPFEAPFTRGRFSADGRTVYVSTWVSGEPADNQHSYVYAIQTANAAPSTPALTSLSLSPASITGGATSQGTVTLSGPAPAGGAVVSLSSSNLATASVPASVTVPAGATSATCTVSTVPVATSTLVTIAASYGAASKSATLTVAPPPSLESVTIQLAEYVTSKRRLRVQARSTSVTAVLTVYVTSTGQSIGALSNLGSGRYSGVLSWPSNPQNITVRSSAGGSATRAVTVK